MKQEIKVGDWVKLGYWKDFFEVTDVTEDEITLKTDNEQYYSSYYKRENWIVKEKVKLYNPWKPHIIRDGHGTYFVRVMNYVSWKYYCRVSGGFLFSA